MSYSAAFRWLFIILLPLTIGWKIVADQPPVRSTKDIVVDFLKRHQFDVEITDKMILSDMPLIRATAGACRMLVAEAAPDGWNREVIRNLAGTMDKSFVIYRGTVYQNKSTLLDVTHYWWSRYLRKLKLSGDALPLIAVAASSSCKADLLPWADLQQP